MARPSNRSQTPTRARPPRVVAPDQKSAQVGRQSAQIAHSSGARTSLLGQLPVGTHRAIASVALVLLLLMSLLAPFAPTAPDPATFITPRVDGSGALGATLTGAKADEVIFPYLSVIERSQAGTSVWPDISAILNEDSEDVRARKAFIGYMYASSAGNLDIRVRDSGLSSNPTSEILSDIEFAYVGMLSSNERERRGVNGLAVIQLMRAFNYEGIERQQLERSAIAGFQTAIRDEPNTWEFTYNWALANMLMGNYWAAYEGLRTIENRDDLNTTKLIPFWRGLAALRAGDPGEAIIQFQSAIDAKVPEQGNDTFRRLYEEARDYSREALGDAYWANRNSAAAYDTYFNLLRYGGTTNAYVKWLRLGLQQRAYDKLAADMATLAASPNFVREARIHHDRARLLTLLGRHGEAEGEYRQAIAMGEGDPTLAISYGQALESRGDHNGALSQAQDAIGRLGKDPATADLSSVAKAAVTTTTSPDDLQAAQQLLDANLLRARAWGAQGNTQAVSDLVGGITQQASGSPPAEAGLLHLYGAFAYEAAGVYGKARDSYDQAWAQLKGLAPGSPGRAAALAGLARTAAGPDDPQAGIDVLKANGYDPSALQPSIAADPDAPDILQQAGLLLERAGRKAEAANAMRVSAVVRNLQDARPVSGVGRPIWTATGTLVPVNALVEAGGASRAVPGEDTGLAAMRYKQAYSLDPAAPDAWNNLGVLYAQTGNDRLADFYLRAAGAVSPSYAWGQHNLATYAYERGIGNLFTAEAAQGAAIKGSGAQSLSWGYNLRYDERGSIPSPAAPPADLLARLPAVVILGLLLLHTLVGRDRQTNRMGLIPTRGLLGRLALAIEGRARETAPALFAPRTGSRALATAIAVPSIIGMLGLAWGAAHGSLALLLVFLPVALLASVVAFGGNEVAQYLAASRAHGTTMHHNWLLGLLLGVVSIPLGFVYGWQVITGVQPAQASVAEDGAVAGRRPRRMRTAEELDLAYEAQVESLAEGGTAEAATPMPTPEVSKGRLGLSPAANILFAGLAANLALGAVFGLVYWLTGWPSMRLGLFASMLVLAFTAVSEPPADGWALYRRNASLWLALFVVAATVVTLLAVGII